MQDFYDFILSRRSVRHFRKESISSEQIGRILKAGIWAPSAHNAQPWRFYVLESTETKRQLAEVMGAAFRRDLEKDGETTETIELVVNESIERFSTAPTLILVCLSMDTLDVYSDERRQQAEFIMGVQSVAAAVQNILLAAHAEGLGACWFCAPLFCQAIVQETLKIPKDVYPQALVALGEPAESPLTPPRRPLDENVFFDNKK
ncbi:MAG: nitroreductase family protein [Candidatus Hermodarchaeia archaeon]|jgi:F420 biosynthesis protein FbiB-like protein